MYGKKKINKYSYSSSYSYSTADIYSFLGAEKQADQLTAGYLNCAGLTQVNLPAFSTNYSVFAPVL
jgi:hypothetical protein